MLSRVEILAIAAKRVLNKRARLARETSIQPRMSWEMDAASGRAPFYLKHANKIKHCTPKEAEQYNAPLLIDALVEALFGSP